MLILGCIQSNTEGYTHAEDSIYGKRIGQGDRLGRSKIYSEIANGKLKARKIGKKTVFLKSDVEAYLNGLPSMQAATDNRG
ncbi:MAG: helix-turn-helix domain-containing protein [Pseudomonadota bacterium]